jgi:hypothetical protein
MVAPLPPLAALPVPPAPGCSFEGTPSSVELQAAGKKAAKLTATVADARRRREAREMHDIK